MRFLLRSAFWLGLTFHAMPWGDAKLSDALPDATPAVVGLVVASANSDGAVGALARGALRGALDLDAPAAARCCDLLSRRALSQATAARGRARLRP